MAYNYDHANKMVEAHRQDLLREAEQQRLLAELPRQQNRIAAKLGMFFTMLGTSLKQLGRTTTRRPVPTSAPLSLESPHH